MHVEQHQDVALRRLADDAVEDRQLLEPVELDVEVGIDHPRRLVVENVGDGERHAQRVEILVAQKVEKKAEGCLLQALDESVVLLHAIPRDALDEKFGAVR